MNCMFFRNVNKTDCNTTFDREGRDLGTLNHDLLQSTVYDGTTGRSLKQPDKSVELLIQESFEVWGLTDSLAGYPAN